MNKMILVAVAFLVVMLAVVGVAVGLSWYYSTSQVSKVVAGVTFSFDAVPSQVVIGQVYLFTGHVSYAGAPLVTDVSLFNNGTVVASAQSDSFGSFSISYPVVGVSGDSISWSVGVQH